MGTLYVKLRCSNDQEYINDIDFDNGDTLHEHLDTALLPFVKDRELQDFHHDGIDLIIDVSKEFFCYFLGYEYEPPTSSGGSMYQVKSFDDLELQCAPSTPPQGTISMTKLVDSKTYFRGTDIKTMNKEGLINSLRTVEAEIESLGQIKTESAAIVKQIDELKGALTVLVTELDSRS